MPVERGGLAYDINVTGKLDALDRFREGLALARQGMAHLKAELASLGSSSNRAKEVMSGAAVAAKAAASAATSSAKSVRAAASEEKARTKAIKDGTQELGIRGLAERKYAKAVEQSAVNREFANISEERGFRLQRRTLTQQQAIAAAATKVTKILNDRLLVEKTLNEIKERGLKLTDTELSKLGVLTDGQKRLAAAKKKLAESQDLANNAMLRGLRIQQTVLAKKTTAQDRAEIARQLFLQGLDQNGNPLKPTQLTIGGGKVSAPKQKPAEDNKDKAQAKTFSDVLRDALGIRKAVDETENSTNKLLFTFRRLVGIFAAFTLIRKGVQAFGELITGAIRFNAELESAQLGLAGIIQSVGAVTDAQGNATDAAASFAGAQKIAAKQVKALRLDALRTTASLEQLTEAFQVALAPGLQAGLNIDQVRNFAVQIAQAATAIGLSQRQLSEEIRSTLSGTINTRNTRIATALGITNADIKKAKELGTLSEFLTDKFKAFTVVGEELGKTFEGSFNRAKSAFEVVNQAASVPLFEEVKTILQDIFTLLVKVDLQNGKITPRPEVLEGLTAVFNSLQRVVAIAREGLGNFNPATFKAVATSVGTIAEVVGAVFVGAVQGVASGLKVIVGFLRTIQTIVLAISGIDIFNSKTLAKTVSYIVKILTVFFGIRVAIIAATRLMPIMTAAFRVASVAALAIQAAVLRTRIALRGATLAAVTLSSTLKGAAVQIGLLVATIAAVEALDRSGLLDRVFGTTGVDTQADSVERLGDTIARVFGEIPGQIATAAESLKNFDATLKTMFESSNKIRAERNLRGGFNNRGDVSGVSSVGLEGPVAEQTKALISSIVDLETQLLNIGKERRANEERLVALAVQYENTQEKIRSLFADDSKARERAVGFEKSITEILKEEEELVNRIAKVKANPTAALEEETRKIADIAREAGVNATGVVVSFDDLVGQLTGRLAKIRADRLDIIQSVTQDEQKQKELVEVLGKRIVIEAESKVLQEEVTKLTEAKTELERATNRELHERIGLLAEEAAFQIRINNIAGQAELEALRKRFAARRQTPAQQDQSESESSLLILRAQLAIEQEKLNLKSQQLQKIIEITRAELALAQAALDAIPEDERATALTEIRQVEAAQFALNQLSAEQLEIEREKELILGQQAERIREAQAALEEARLKAADGPQVFFEQVQFSIAELARTLPSQFDIIFNTLRDGIQSFSAFVSSSIVDAFDPTKKVDIQARFAEFLQGIAQQIINTLIQIAVTKAILGLATGFSAGGLVQGFAHGGQARRPRGHQRRGFADGGQTSAAAALPSAPPGLDKRDRVPVFARIGEWLVPPERGQEVGSDFMWALINGELDPHALRAMVHSRKGAKTYSRSAPRGFATGGVAGANVPVPSGSSAPSAVSAGPTAAYIVANEATADRFLAGGKPAFLRFLDENGYRRS